MIGAGERPDVPEDLRTLRQRPPASAACREDHLGGHRHRDLGGRLGADVEAERRVDARQPVCGHALRRELLEGGPHPTLASDHADVSRLIAATRELPKEVVIVAMPARDEDDARPAPDLDAGQRVGEVGDQDAIGAREPLAGRELGPVV